MGVHPLRDGKPGGDGEVQVCSNVKGSLPKPMHCDSVERANRSGEIVLPKDGARRPADTLPLLSPDFGELKIPDCETSRFSPLPLTAVLDALPRLGGPGCGGPGDGLRATTLRACGRNDDVLGSVVHVGHR